MSNDTNHTDLVHEEHLIALAKQDITHFEGLYTKYFDTIFRFIYRRTDDESLTADLCSQVFYKAMRNLRKFVWKGRPFGAWLYAIARNEVKKHYRNRKEVFVIEEEHIKAIHEWQPNNHALDPALIISLFEGLTEDEVHLLELKYFEQNTFHDMALVLGMTESAVKMKLYRLLHSLKKKVNE